MKGAGVVRGLEAEPRTICKEDRSDSERNVTRF